jgi:hypothetical protein
MAQLCDKYVVIPVYKHEVVRMLQLTPWSLALKNQPALSYSRISQHFVEPEGSVPYSQQSATGPYPELDESSPYLPILFSKIHFNIIIPPTH